MSVSDFVDPKINKFLTEFQTGIQARREEIIAKIGEEGFNELMEKAQRRDSERMGQWQTYHDAKAKALERSGRTPEDSLRATKEALALIRDPAVREMVEPDIADELGAFDAFDHLKQKMGLLIGDPEKLTRDFRNRLATVAGPIGEALAELTDYARFSGRFREALKSSPQLKGERPEDRVVRVAGDHTQLGAALKIIAEDPTGRSEALQELGVDPSAIRQYAVDKVLRKFPELEGTVGQNRKDFESFALGKEVYLQVGANQEGMADKLVESGEAANLDQGVAIIRAWLRKAHENLEKAKGRLPKTAVFTPRTEEAGGIRAAGGVEEDDPFGLPPPPAEPQAGFRQFLSGAFRGVADLYGPLERNLGSSRLSGISGLQAPRPPEREGFLANLFSADTVGEITGWTLGMLPSFRAAAATKIPKTFAKIPGVGGILGGSAAFGIAEGLTPETDVGVPERLERGRTAFSLGLGLGAGGKVLGKGIKGAIAAEKGIRKGIRKGAEAIEKRALAPQRPTSAQKTLPKLPAGKTAEELAQGIITPEQAGRRAQIVPGKPQAAPAVAARQVARVESRLRTSARKAEALARPTPTQPAPDVAPSVNVFGRKPTPGALQASAAQEPFVAHVIPNKGTPPKIRDVMVEMGNVAGFSIRTQKQTPGVAGHVSLSNLNVSIGRAGDIRTATHEVAHRLNQALGIVGIETKKGFKLNPELPGKVIAEMKNDIFHQSVPKGADPLLTSHEIFSEMFSLWMINPKQAKQIMPGMVKVIENAVGPEAVKRFGKIQRDIGLVTGAEPLKRISAQKVKPSDLRTSWLDWLKGHRGKTPPDEIQLGFVDRFLTATQNRMRPATVVVKKEFERITGGKKLLPSQDPEALYGQHLGSMEALESMMQEGLRTYRKRAFIKDAGQNMNMKWLIEPFTKTGNKSPKQIDELMDLTENYMIGQRIIEKGRQGVKRAGLATLPGESEQQIAAKTILELRRLDPATFATVKEAARRYRKMADVGLQWLKDSGRISAEELNQIRASNTQYVTFQRLMEIDTPGARIITPDVFGAPGKRISAPRTPVQRFHGSTRPIVNPYLTLYEGLGKAFQESTRNQFMNSVAGLARGEFKGLYGGSVADVSRIGRKLDRPEAGAIPIWNRGKQEFWRFDPAISQALKAVDAVDRSYAILAMPKRMLQTSIIHMPSFLLRNFIRDTFSTLARTGTSISKSPILSWIPRKPLAAFKPLKNSEIADFKSWGGSNSGWYMRDKVSWEKGLQREVEAQIPNKNFLTLNPLKIFQKGWDPYKRLINRSELQNRVREQQRWVDQGIKEGLPLEEAKLLAMSKARGLMDFALVGSHMNFLRQTVPFLNPAIQATYSFARAAKDRPGSFAVKVGLAATAIHHSERAWNTMMGADDLWREQPDYRRDLFAMYYIGDDRWVTIPKDYELGFFTSIVRRFDEEKNFGKKDAWEGTGMAALRTFIPGDVTSLAGPGALPIELATNTNLFYQSPIIPHFEKDLEPERRKGRQRASAMAQAMDDFVKGVGPKKGLGIGERIVIDDPRQWDFIIERLTGTAGARLKELSTSVFEPEAVKKGEKRGITVARLTGLGATTAARGSTVRKVLELAERKGISRTKEIAQFKKTANSVFALPEGTKRREDRIRQINRKAESLLSRLKRRFPE